jgi:hypothetical protein
LKVLHISYSNDTGGAARAAHRINESLNVLGIKSEICIVKTSSKNKNLNTTYPKNFFDKDILKIKILFAKLFQILCCSFREKISFNIIPSFYSKFINKSDFDLVNIHWIGNETISFDDIQKINKPVIALKDGIVVEEYPSLKMAGIAHKSHSGNIIKYMKEGKPYHGMMWEYKNKK